MATTYRFRVLIDYEDDVFRDIEIDSESSFEKFHLAIQNAFAFDGTQMASFYLSDDNWEKGQEIALFDVDEGFAEDPILTMANTPLSALIQEKGDKLIYVFDFLLLWCFYCELVRKEEREDQLAAAQLVQSFGVAPEQYSKAQDDDLENMALANLAEQLKDLDTFGPDADPGNGDEPIDPDQLAG